MNETPTSTIALGSTHTLEVTKLMEFGVYLNAQSLGSVLLPNKHAPKGLVPGDMLTVFLYLDSEDRPVATTQRPRVQVGQFAYLNVLDKTDVGAFLDWGLDKDVLVPFSEQHRPMEVGHSYLVYVYLNGADGRITASSKIDKFLNDDTPHEFIAKQPVELIIANTTELGFKAIINHSHWGVLYKNDVHQRLSFGQSITGFVRRVRPDGKIDLSLQGGQETRDKYAKAIESYLIKQGGFAPIHDKSDPQLISKTFGMSKGAFKKAIGGLYKQKIIEIEKNGIRLTRTPE